MPVRRALEAGAHWPTPEQTLLVRAASLRGEAALSAWRDWRARVGIERADPQAFLLLPLLHRNLERLGAAAGADARLAGIRRQCWARNETLLGEAAAALEELGSAQLKPLLAGGAALALLRGKERWLRPLYSVELIPAGDDGARVLSKLFASGWRLPRRLPRLGGSAALALLPAVNLRRGTGRLTLLRAATHQSPVRGGDRYLLESSVGTGIHGFPVRALSPEHLLIEACLRAGLWRRPPGLAWIVDVLSILGPWSGNTDRAALLDRISLLRAVLPVREALSWLDRALEPEAGLAEILADLAGAEISAKEINRHESRIAPPNLRRRLRRHWKYYAAEADDAHRARTLTGFLARLYRAAIARPQAGRISSRE